MNLDNDQLKTVGQVAIIAGIILVAGPLVWDLLGFALSVNWAAAIVAAWKFVSSNPVGIARAVAPIAGFFLLFAGYLILLFHREQERLEEPPARGR